MIENEIIKITFVCSWEKNTFYVDSKFHMREVCHILSSISKAVPTEALD